MPSHSPRLAAAIAVRSDRVLRLADRRAVVGPIAVSRARRARRPVDVSDSRVCVESAHP